MSAPVSNTDVAFTEPHIITFDNGEEDGDQFISKFTAPYICSTCDRDFTDETDGGFEEIGKVICMECFYEEEEDDEDEKKAAEMKEWEKDMMKALDPSLWIGNAQVIDGVVRCDLPSVDELKEIEEERIWRLRN